MYPTVALDLDGVLLDFEAAWKTCSTWTLRRPVERITDDYALEDRFGLSRREVARVWDAFHRDRWWVRVHPYPERLGQLRHRQPPPRQGRQGYLDLELRLVLFALPPSSIDTLPRSPS